MKEPKVELEYEIDLSEITHKGLQRMLRNALSQSRARQMPLHKRASVEVENEDVDEETEEADDENSKLVELSNSKGSPAPIPVTDEDMPESVASKLPMKKKGKKSNG